MEQRIGSSSQPLDGAGIDPAFIPGLTSPASTAESEDKPDVTVPEETAPVEDRDSEAVPAAVADAEDEPDADDEPDAYDAPEAEPEEGSASDGPVFEASDRRARIVADHSGVRLRLDDQACEFRWDEIGAVETETARFGKRFTVTVHTPERRWYPIEIEADSRSRFQEWENRLDAVLDAYFEDGAEEPATLEKADD
ncbi:hypothetical protein [Streptomyces chiangmaiensis]|uniref:Uncharacterized protein n=1 Tax=Streptomyces chiangmaiensis TaxID=766497 RepID=A0ABU7FAC6_9ACTN|nr:hypothetical protein [Streptomyces chiangmaiensis]MED7821145.1 hypothetical protein [Streptomyces chiangmaiensis]